jgi:UDPglucose 6-dehydrogenase
LPIYEPGLDEVVKAARGRNLYFSTDTHKHVGEADIVFVRFGCLKKYLARVGVAGLPMPTFQRVGLAPCSVNTPTKTRGVGAGKAADLTYWEGAARMIAAVSKSSKIIVEKSTVPVKTAEAIEKVVELGTGEGKPSLH